jgi:putative addiction module component (TIGR02574 family)
MQTDKLIEELVSLPVEERARVADHILRSLNPPNADSDKKWADLAKRRLAELQNGQTGSVPGDEVFARICQRFHA